MAQRYDVSLKALFLREGDGILRRLLFGGKVIEHLATEQPQIFNRVADMLVRTEDNELHQVEFQSSNEIGFVLRMMEYYAYLVRMYRQHIVQTVLYMGREPLRMETRFDSPSMQFRFEIVNLRELDAEPLLASDDWADNALALLAKGDSTKVLEILLPRLRAMQSSEQNWASATLLLLSGIIGIEETVNQRLQEVGMINVMENKVLGPLIQQRFEQGLEQGLERGLERGLEQGRSQGQQMFLLEQLDEKFGSVPLWARERVERASEQQIHDWAKRILRSTSLEETLA